MTRGQIKRAERREAIKREVLGFLGALGTIAVIWLMFAIAAIM